MKSIAFVEEIVQKDPTHFFIRWTDGLIHSYLLADLQRNCPCANCCDEITGVRNNHPENIPDTLQAKRLYSVGRYALRVLFQEGCSEGIFDFDLLRTIGTAVEPKKERERCSR